MKIIKRIITAFIVISISGLILSFLTIQFLLFRETESLRAAINQARNYSFHAPHEKDCLNPDHPEASHRLEGYQLRFISDTDYVIEAVCGKIDKTIIPVSMYQLKMGVHKLPGYSGMYFPLNETTLSEPVNSSIVLKLLNFYRAITYQERSLLSFYTDPVTLPKAGTAPANTSCQGWGYICCDNDTQVGFGVNQSDHVTDCSSNCYQSCNGRPAILYFNSEPRLDAETRLVTVPNHQLVLFSYSVQDPESEPVTIKIDFGDNQSATSTNVTDSASHTYDCPNNFCSYQVNVMVTDQSGLSQVTSRLSQITINISNR